MYSPETIKRLNAESSLRWPEEVNRALMTIKAALRQVKQADGEIETARKFKVTRPEHSKQFELAEEFYVAERKRLLDLEEPVSTLAGIREALVSLLNHYEKERITLEGRLFLIEHGGDGDNSTHKAAAHGGLELQQRYALVLERCDRIRLITREIRQVLNEYAVSCAASLTTSEKCNRTHPVIETEP